MMMKSNGFIWKIKQNSYIFVTNPKFYKIESLEKETSKAQRPLVHCPGHRVKPRKVFKEELWRSGGFDGLTTKKDETDR